MPYLLFDDTADEIVYWTFRWPSAYSGETVTMKVQYSMVSATTGNVRWLANVWAITPGDSVDADTESFDTVSGGNDAVPGTAGYVEEYSITLSNLDGVVAGDLVTVRLWRQGSDAGDTATGDAELRSVTLEFS